MEDKYKNLVRYQEPTRERENKTPVFGAGKKGVAGLVIMLVLALGMGGAIAVTLTQVNNVSMEMAESSIEDSFFNITDWKLVYDASTNATALANIEVNLRNTDTSAHNATLTVAVWDTNWNNVGTIEMVTDDVLGGGSMTLLFEFEADLGELEYVRFYLQDEH